MASSKVVKPICMAFLQFGIAILEAANCIYVSAQCYARYINVSTGIIIIIYVMIIIIHINLIMSIISLMTLNEN